MRTDHGPLLALPTQRRGTALGATIAALLVLATAPGNALSNRQRLADTMSSYAAQAARVAQGVITDLPAALYASLPASVNKCVIAGITTYTDSDCEAGAPLRLASDPAEAMPIAEPRRQQAIADAAQSQRSQFDRQPAIVAALPALRQARCNAALAELRNIDALTQLGQPADMQAFLDARRQEKRHELFLYRC